MSEHKYPDIWVDPDDDPRDTGENPVGELANLRAYLRHYRLTLEMKCEGLDAEQLARRSVPPSTLSLLGLVRHLAGVEHHWFQRVLQGKDEPRLYVSEGDVDLDAQLPVHGKPTQVRDILVHMVEEYARHVGHADLLRECIDGRTGQ